MDVVTADCLALREQVKIYEEQLAHMEAQHETVREKGHILVMTGWMANIDYPTVLVHKCGKVYYSMALWVITYKCMPTDCLPTESSDLWQGLLNHLIYTSSKLFCLGFAGGNTVQMTPATLLTRFYHEQ